MLASLPNSLHKVNITINSKLGTYDKNPSTVFDDIVP